jgi:Spy/CpxP family protein refolding chaperone
MKSLKIWLLLALVFLAGVVAGVVGTRAMVRHAVQNAILHPEKTQVMLERNLTRKLELDNGQRVKLHQILAATHSDMKNLRREYQPRFFEVVSNAEGQITAILTPEQQAKFDRLLAEKLPYQQALEQNR